MNIATFAEKDSGELTIVKLTTEDNMVLILNFSIQTARNAENICQISLSFVRTKQFVVQGIMKRPDVQHVLLKQPSMNSNTTG